MLQKDFGRVPTIAIERSVMDRSTHHKTTLNASKLVPIFVDEVLPGDTWSMKCTIFMRLITLLSPIMDNLYLNTYFFWCPMRILWDHARAFWGEHPEYQLTAQTQYSIPQIMSPNNGADPITLHSVADYFGLPLNLTTGLNNTDQECSALPFRAYNRIWARFFRDQNLQDVTVDDLYTGDSTQQMENCPLRTAAKFHDYFTSCLPYAQKGDPIQLPLGESAPVWGDGYGMNLWDGTETPQLYINDSGIPAFVEGYPNHAVGTTVSPNLPEDQNTLLGLRTKNDTILSHLYADLSEAIGPLVNELRLSVALQRMLEKDSRFGTRYKEFLKGHFGVEFNDSIYEPEYLGGTKQRIAINPVTKTYEDAGEYQVGDLRATGTLADSSFVFNKSFTEHGYILGLCVVRGDLTYSQGIHKMWTRQLPEDFYDPSLAHIGEQPVLVQEIYNQNDQVLDKETFGYQEPWAEYRYKPAQLTGLMRPGAPLALTSWTIAENFTAAPELNEDFILDKTPLNRVLTMTEQPNMKADIFLGIKCARPMPLYSVPGLMDHF